jgi:hypothetical protein
MRLTLVVLTWLYQRQLNKVNTNEVERRNIKMEAIVKGQMEGIKFGEIQIHNHVTIIPMIEYTEEQSLAINAEGKGIEALKAVNPVVVSLSPHNSSDWSLEQFRKSFGTKFVELKAGKEINL